MIKFKTIRWKNFLSTGNVYTEINLDRSPSTVIVGENGSGKSTLLDALCWVLFNKPFRNIRMLQLINSINEKDCRAEVEFTIGNVHYKVARAYKPTSFEIYKNDKLIPQPGNNKDYQNLLEETVLKLNYKSFTQIVVLGNASFTPFMQLSTRDRREVIEDLLDIQIFSKMNILLRDQMSKNKNDIRDTEYQMELLEEKVKVKKEYLDKIDQDNEKLKAEIQEEIQEWRMSILSTQSQEQGHVESIQELTAKIVDSAKISSKMSKVSELMMKLHDKVSSAEKRINFYQKHDNCPTCEQILDVKEKADKIAETESTIKKTQDAIDQLKEEQQKISKKADEIQRVSEEIKVLEQHVRDCRTSIKNYEQNLSRVQDRMSKVTQDLSGRDETVEEIAGLKKSHDTYESKMEELSQQKEVFSIATKILKDGGIKTKIIKQYVPIMNKLVNKYLSAMDFFVKFELDEEFNEVIKSRFRDDFSYASFSEGEKMRIDLALLFTWRAIAKLKNSTNTNLLILDEVFDASLDTNGCDEFLKLLQELGGDTNVFVISHKTSLVDKFRSQIKFEKFKNFSRISPNPESPV